MQHIETAFSCLASHRVSTLQRRAVRLLTMTCLVVGASAVSPSVAVAQTDSSGVFTVTPNAAPADVVSKGETTLNNTASKVANFDKAR